MTITSSKPSFPMDAKRYSITLPEPQNFDVPTSLIAPSLLLLDCIYLHKPFAQQNTSLFSASVLFLPTIYVYNNGADELLEVQERRAQVQSRATATTKITGEAGADCAGKDYQLYTKEAKERQG